MISIILRCKKYTFLSGKWCTRSNSHIPCSLISALRCEKIYLEPEKLKCKTFFLDGKDMINDISSYLELISNNNVYFQNVSAQ